MARAQFAMEYILVAAFSLLVLLPVTAILYGQYDENRTQIAVEHLSEVSRTIIYQAERVYMQGAPSQTSFEVYFPKGVESVSINQYSDPDSGDFKASSIEFKFSSSPATISASTTIEIKGSLETFSGPHTIILTVDDNDTPQDTSDDFVLISER